MITWLTGTSAAGSGYGTSSGSMRVMTDRSQTTCPPDRSVRTRVSPSIVYDLTDSARPDSKNTSSALAGAARASRVARAAHEQTGSRTFGLFLRFHERVEHAHAELAGVLVRGARLQRRHERLVDGDLE